MLIISMAGRKKGVIIYGRGGKLRKMPLQERGDMRVVKKRRTLYS